MRHGFLFSDIIYLSEIDLFRAHRRTADHAETIPLPDPLPDCLYRVEGEQIEDGGGPPTDDQKSALLVFWAGGDRFTTFRLADHKRTYVAVSIVTMERVA